MSGETPNLHAMSNLNFKSLFHRNLKQKHFRMRTNCSSVWQRKRWLEFGMARPLNGGDKILSRESQRTKFRCLSLLHLAARSIKARRMILIDLWPQPIETTITICQPGRLQMVRVKLRFRHHRRRTNKFIVLQSTSCGDVGP